MCKTFCICPNLEVFRFAEDIGSYYHSNVFNSNFIVSYIEITSTITTSAARIRLVNTVLGTLNRICIIVCTTGKTFNKYSRQYV